MTITRDGKYYRRGDEQKRPVRILCVDACGNWPVIYLDENKSPTYCKSQGFGHSEHDRSPYDLLPIPAAPKLVPFTRETWPGSRYVAEKLLLCDRECFVVNGVDDTGITITTWDFSKKPMVTRKSWNQLMELFLHGDSHKLAGPWHECGVTE